MALLLHERAIETDSQDLVRLTLVEGGASSQIVDALIPNRPLQPGEQYRFHFDMTKCIGCRSCEVACNEQNGNPAEIKWRRLGELEGGVYPHTQRTYLSMGCNHCLSADCLRGCPVNAYTKDADTGIVLHSAEACIGCQYCVWNCPYSVPQFNPERGIVGKCDMCRGRLLEGLEPACVNACPENAIQIEIVDKEVWRNNYATADAPGLPPAGQTISTTRITLPNNTESWLQRVDTGSVGLEHAHTSLIVMTTLVQATFGAFVAGWLLHSLDPVFVLTLVTVTAVALTTSVLHLGRPAYAWRAIRMWRRSWLSREVVCFGLYFGAMVMCVVALWGIRFGYLHAETLAVMSAASVVMFGGCGTVASACIYMVKARPAWNMMHTPIDFLLSSALMGVTLGIVLGGANSRAIGGYLGFETVITGAWIANHVVRAIRLGRSTNFESRASYNLLRSRMLCWKGLVAMMSAAAVPILVAAHCKWQAAIASALAVGISRYLFFVAVVPLRMALTFLQVRPASGRTA